MPEPSAPAFHTATLCLHGGWRASPAQPAVVLPIVQSSTFLLDDPSYAAMVAGRHDEALIYTRLGNPTVDAAAAEVARLHEARHCLMTASGMAAIATTLVTLVRSGDTVVAAKQVYGDTGDLDTVASWTQIATLTLSSEKTSSTTSMTNATIPADRVIRTNWGTIVGSPKDASTELFRRVPLTT